MAGPLPAIPPLSDRERQLLMLMLSLRNLASALRRGTMQPERAAIFLDDYAAEIENELEKEKN